MIVLSHAGIQPLAFKLAGAGDNCLADNACFGHHGEGYGSDLTYQAGCTDPDYNDDSCPDKKGIGTVNQQDKWEAYANAD